MTIEETRARRYYAEPRKLVQKVRETSPNDPNAMTVIADAMDSVLDLLVEQKSLDGAMIVVLDDEALEALTEKQKAAWKGYVYKMTYENWDEESLEIGETDDKGWENEGSEPYDTLDDILRCVGSDANWLEWSSSSPDQRSWITSEGDQNSHTGDTKYKSLWINRADGFPKSEEEIIYISQKLGLRHPKIGRK
jgi:hypothetical protein